MAKKPVRASLEPSHVKLIREHAERLELSPTRLLMIAGFTSASWTHWRNGRDIKMGTLNHILSITAEDVSKSKASKKR